MKYSFAISAIVAIAAAQYNETYGYMDENPMYANDTAYYNETEPTLAEKLFEKNEEGNFQLVFPENPAISFTDADDAAMMEWWEGRMGEYDALDREFIDAWKNYESAVSQPWDNFVTQAEDLTVRGIQLDAKTDQEIIEWMASNTFVDGQALIDKYPAIENVLAGIQAKADEMGESFNLDFLRATPTALYYDRSAKPRHLQTYYSEENDKTYYYDDYYNDYYYYDDSYVPYEPEPTPVRDAMEKAAAEMKENLFSYGFDPKVVNSWFADKSQTWEEIQHQQDLENAEQAQQDIREAADYLKGVADKWVADMPIKHEEDMQMMEEKIQGMLSDWKVKVDE